MERVVPNALLDVAEAGFIPFGQDAEAAIRDRPKAERLSRAVLFAVLQKARSSVLLVAMLTLTVTEAKPKLGHLVDLALKSKPIFIRRGRQVVQLVPAVLPDPIAVYPEGALARSDHQIRALTQRFSDDEDQPLHR